MYIEISSRICDNIKEEFPFSPGWLYRTYGGAIISKKVHIVYGRQATKTINIYKPGTQAYRGPVAKPLKNGRRIERIIVCY